MSQNNLDLFFQYEEMLCRLFLSKLISSSSFQNYNQKTFFIYFFFVLDSLVLYPAVFPE